MKKKTIEPLTREKKSLIDTKAKGNGKKFEGLLEISVHENI